MENPPKRISQEEIDAFMNGYDPMERIVNLTYSYKDDFITIFYRNEKDQKCSTTQKFYPFCWATYRACDKLCGGNRKETSQLLRKYNIGVKRLSNTSYDGTIRTEFNNGYLFMFYALKPMSYQRFLTFFKDAGNPVYGKRDKNGNEIIRPKEEEKQFLVVPPQEQFMIATGKRFFKGYDDYDQLLRLSFDLETEGLDAKKHRIKQLGLRFNRPFNGYPNGFQKIFSLEGTTKEEKDKSELRLIKTFCKAIKVFNPDIVCGHNIENFDIQVFIGACERLGTTFEDVSKEILGEPIRKEARSTILKLGGEIEEFNQTLVPNTILTDSLHAVRRAQAMDSNMQRADLKYATKYSGMVKKNRVYTPGDKIDFILTDLEEHYAFNNNDGDWYVYDPVNGSSVKTREEFDSDKEYDEYIKSIKSKQGDGPFKMRSRNALLDGYQLVSGRYIVERYLLDDIWEGDRVEWKFNSTNFLICKMLPVPYKKCTTMGTAGQWKALLLAWSYRHNLAVPMFGESKTFTGGLSRLLQTGYAPNVIKLDYNSLYPSIILTWGISDTNDLMGSMLKFLEYVLTTREKFKGMKKAAGKIVDSLKEKIINKIATPEEITQYNKAVADYALADGKQMQMKVLGNSFFGSYGAPNVFPFGSLKCAEQTTCTGRQSLRLMISHFKKLGYEPIVGDSVLGDTPLFIKYKNSHVIDIKPISEIINENHIERDLLGREYDYSEKPYLVLCRSGWSEVSYVYRHDTEKDIYRVSNSKGHVDVTQDHSLFKESKEKIKPSQITDSVKLEEYDINSIETLNNNLTDDVISQQAKKVANGIIDRVPSLILNASKEVRVKFYAEFIKHYNDKVNLTKTCLAGIRFILR